MADVSKDGSADVLGFGNDGVWLITSSSPKGYVPGNDHVTPDLPLSPQ